MKKVTLSILAAASAVAPVASFATTATDTVGNPIQRLVEGLVSLTPDLIKLALAVAVLGFIYSLTIFIIKGDKEHGKTVMIWGLGALFIMFSFFGIIDLLQQLVFNGTVGTPDVPTFPTGATATTTS